MKLEIRSLDNQKKGDIELSSDIYGLEPRKDILARMVNYQLAKRRAGTHKVKTRAEIARTGAKLFRQKGTGRARAGSARVSQFRGGGVAFGPHNRDHAHKLPKKIRALALKMALSSKIVSKQLIVLEDLSIKDSKTKSLQAQLNALGMKNALFIGDNDVALYSNFDKAVRNIPNMDILPARGINVYDILRREQLVLSKAAIAYLQERLA